MKKSGSFFILILFLCLNQCSVKEANIQPIERSVGKLQISIDPRMELLTAVQIVSDYPFIHRDYPYCHDILNFFQPFSSKDAVTITNSLMENYGFGADAPVHFMLHLSQPPKLEIQNEIINDLLERSGGIDNLEQYRKAMQQFAETSNFDAFWNNKMPFYNQILRYGR